MNFLNPIGYYYVTPTGTLPEEVNGHLYSYVVAGNGIFLYAKRDALEVLLKIESTVTIKGLQSLIEFIHIERVPKDLLIEAMRHAWDFYPKEFMCWFNYFSKYQCYELFMPQQLATIGSVIPVDKYDPGGTSALIDLHSHGQLHAFFSSTDDADEQGFRIYAVMGRLNTPRPEITVRIGIYEHFFEIPASYIFDLPYFVKDLNNEFESR